MNKTPEQLMAEVGAPAPKGKRSVRLSKYGVQRAYIAGKFWRQIGDAELSPYHALTAEEVRAFLAGEID